MKRFWMIAAMGVLAIVLTGCNNGGGAEPSAAGSQSAGQDASAGADSAQQGTVEAGSPEEVLANIQADFNDTAQKLYDEQAAMFDEVGENFDDYTANQQLVNDWYALALSETEALGERTYENSKVYFQSVINTVDPSDDDAIHDAIEAYYDAIYEDAYGDYYDAVYEDAFKDAYDQFYDGILADALDTGDYGVVSDARSEEYDNWSDARSDVYNAISDARSDVYDVSSDAYSAYYDDEFVLDEIFRDPVVNVKKNDEE